MNGHRHHLLKITTLALLLAPLGVHSAETSPPFKARLQTAVSFKSDNADLQRLHDAAEARLGGNIVRFTPSMKILVEGGGYQNAWLETQPMGGEMMPIATRRRLSTTR